MACAYNGSTPASDPNKHFRLREMSLCARAFAHHVHCHRRNRRFFFFFCFPFIGLYQINFYDYSRAPHLPIISFNWMSFRKNRKSFVRFCVMNFFFCSVLCCCYFCLLLMVLVASAFGLVTSSKGNTRAFLYRHITSKCIVFPTSYSCVLRRGYGKVIAILNLFEASILLWLHHELDIRIAVEWTVWS